MPKFNVVSPDGLTYQVNAPEGATQEQAIKYVQDEVAAGRLSPTPKQEEQAVAEQDGGGLAGSLRRIDLNAGTNIANIPSALADSLASATAWAGGKLGIGDGTYIPAPRFQVSEEDKPQGFVEEFASEAIPYLIPTGVGAGVGAASRAGRIADALGRNAAQSVVGSLANNSDGALDSEFAEELAANAVLGAGAEKVLGGVANTIRAGKAKRRAVMENSLANEAGANAHIRELSSELHNLNRGNKIFEQGLVDPTTGEPVLRSAGQLQKYIQDNPDMFAQGRDLDYVPGQVDAYIKRFTDNQYGLGDELPEELASRVFTKSDTALNQKKVLDEARDAYRFLESSKIGDVDLANQAINEAGSGFIYPAVDVGRLSPEARKQLGLSRLERVISRIGSAAESNLPFDIGTQSRLGSVKALNEKQEALTRLADTEINSLYNKKTDNPGIAKALDKQAEAWEAAKRGDKFSKLPDSELNNILTSSNQARILAGEAGEGIKTPADLSRGVGGLERAKETNPYKIGGLASLGTTWLFGGAPLAAQAGLAGAGRILNGAIARDLRRVQGQTVRGDKTLNAIGDAVDNVGTNVNVAGVLGGDMYDENEKRIEQLDDWATKNGIPSEILSQAVAIKGSDLGSLKGVNAIKGLALDLHTESRANDPSISLSESFNPDHTLATRQISQAMREAMNGLSDDEQEEIIDDYLDSVHLEEDEKLVGLKLQRAIQKAVQHALDKSS